MAEKYCSKPGGFIVPFGADFRDGNTGIYATVTQP